MSNAIPNVPASSAAISNLVVACPVTLPESYIELLKQTNGGEWSLAVQPYTLSLDKVESVVQAIAEGTYSEFFDGFVIIGSDGGGELVALDTRGEEPWSVVALDMTNINLDESRFQIASSFDQLLGLVEFAENQD